MVRRGIADVEAFWAMLDDYVVWDARDFPFPDSLGVIVGRADVIENSRRYWGTWDDYRLEVEEIVDRGSRVVIAVRERGRGKGSGVPVDRRWAQVWTFGRGRIIRWELFPDLPSALEAAGP